MKVWSFGDSWGAGWGLTPKEAKLGDHIATYFNFEHINKSESGSSLGQIAWDFQRHMNKITSDDVVIIIIPPDIRWYTERDGGWIKSLFLGMDEYDTFVKDKTSFWFQYHHSLFIHTIYSLCQQINCKLMMQHNYGQLVITDEFKKFIPDTVFLNKNKSLTELLGAEDWKGNYEMDHDGPPNHFEGPYFIPGDTHPNAKGHEQIAKFFIKRFKQCL